MRQLSIFAAALGVAGLAAGSALAADAVFPSAPAAAGYWNGAYVGVQAGYAWDDAPFTAAGETDPLDTIHLRGGLIGGRLGMDMQRGNWVFGILGDISAADIKANITNIGGSGSDVSAKADWVGTFRGRLGMAANNWLIYGTAGLAVARVNATVSNLAPGDLGSDTRSNTFAGWTAGIGAELALTSNMTVGLEWLYADYGTQNYHFDDGAGTIDASTHLKGNTIMASLNWRMR
jgi:outer membrane immunogenic protein